MIWSIAPASGLSSGRRALEEKRPELYKVCRMLSQARVPAGDDFTEASTCPGGLKQSEVCSPFFFGLFINELAVESLQNVKHETTLSSELIQILIILTS